MCYSICVCISVHYLCISYIVCLSVILNHIYRNEEAVRNDSAQ